MEFVPLYKATYALAPPRIIAGTPTGTQILFEVRSGRLEGERVNGAIRELSGDWLTISPMAGSVRSTCGSPSRRTTVHSSW